MAFGFSLLSIRLKIFNIVLCLSVMILGYKSFENGLAQDRFFVGTITTVALGAAALLAALVTTDIKLFRLVDHCFYVIAGALLVSAGIVYINTTSNLPKLGAVMYNERIAAGVLSVAGGILCGVIVCVIWREG